MRKYVGQDYKIGRDQAILLRKISFSPLLKHTCLASFITGLVLLLPIENFIIRLVLASLTYLTVLASLSFEELKEGMSYFRLRKKA